MELKANTVRDIAMKGGGYYSQATTGARDVIDGAAGLLLDAIGRMELDRTRPFTMTDMGCADGGTSIGTVGRVLKAVRDAAPERPIQIVYTDLPRNDFSQVFQVVHGLTDIPTYAREIEGLYVFASATSFHRPIVPPGTLDLGFSATASHYISEKPCRISNHVHMVGAEGEERAAYAEQGRRDWQSMLENRARELAPGGRLVLLNFGIDEAGRYLGNTGGANMFDTFDRLWRALVDDGTITRDEYLNTNFPQHYRTVAEFTAPFEDPANPVHKAGLRLEHVETRVVACPFAADFARHGDPARFARAYIPTLRSWSETSFAAGLDPQRPLAERAAILDRFYDSYEALVRERPEGHAMDYVHCYLVAGKTG
jgi:hypothetical protein